MASCLETKQWHQTDWENSSTSVFKNSTPQYDYISPSRDFPICTDLDTPLVPFCLPHDGADVFVDATYYVTWNADFYPLNATITIELRYSDSTEGDSAFTSARVDNSYGYVPIHMSGEWLQGKSQNALTLYIIELEPASDRRASAQQGPTITLHTKPMERYRHPPPLPFNKVALYIGLPVSLGVVITVVAGLFFGMRESRRIGIGNIMGSRGKGYGIRKSKFERLGQESNDHRPESFAILKKQYEDQVHWPFPETAQRDDDLECRPSDVEREASRPNSWRLR